MERVCRNAASYSKSRATVPLVERKFFCSFGRVAAGTDSRATKMMRTFDKVLLGFRVTAHAHAHCFEWACFDLENRAVAAPIRMLVDCPTLRRPLPSFA